MAPHLMSPYLSTGLGKNAHELGIDIAAAAQKGVADEVRAVMAESDRDVYARNPERPDALWDDLRAWTDD